MPAAQLSERSVLAELEQAMRNGPADKRSDSLRQITDLFLNESTRLSDDQVRVFDDVLCLLIGRVETRARAELGKSLAQLDNAPAEVIQRLATDDEIVVAGAVLTHSPRVSTTTLVEIASSRGQDHLLAISGRVDLPEAVTDVIIDRGERKVIRKLASNSTARFSDTGYAGMVGRAERDEELIEILGVRTDLPAGVLRELLQRATDAVMARMLAIAPPQLQQDIMRVIKSIADTAVRKVPAGRSATAAEQLVRRMRGAGELTEAAIIAFAEAGRFEEVAAALALLVDVPTDSITSVLTGPRNDLILLPCKAAGLSWPAVDRILTRRPSKFPVDARILNVAARDYERLGIEQALRTVRSWPAPA